MQTRTRVGVIGVGNMGKNHARVYHELEGVDLVGVADLDESLITQIAGSYDTKGFTDYKKMLDVLKIEAVSVCVPTTMHHEVVSHCLTMGVDVLVEKPIAGSLKDAQSMITQAKKEKRILMVGHIERFNPAVVRVKQLLDSGLLGEVMSLIFRRVGGFPPQIKDADIAVDLAIHDVDIASYLLGVYPKKMEIFRQKAHLKGRADGVEIFGAFGKTNVFIQANWITPVKIRTLSVTGTEGYLEMDYVSQSVKIYKSIYEKFEETYKNYSDYVLKFSEPVISVEDVKKGEPLKEELSFFITHVRNRSVIEIDHAIEALRIVL